MHEHARDLDSVRLRSEVDGFPAGTMGTVISEYEDYALVEIVETEFDRDGLPVHDLFEDLLVDVPYDALEVLQRGRGRPAHRSAGYSTQRYKVLR